MIVDHRTYTIRLECFQDFLGLVEEEVVPIQIEHLGNLLGYFTTETGTLCQVVHLWGFESLGDREKRRAALYSDERFQQLGKKMSSMVMSQHVQLLRPTNFSPIR